MNDSFFSKLRENLINLKIHQPDPFVILSSARTGSTWLHKLLGTHPHLYVLGELLDPFFKMDSLPEKDFLNRDIMVRNILECRRSYFIQGVGFKLHYSNFGDLRNQLTYMRHHRKWLSPAYVEEQEGIIQTLESKIGLETFKKQLETTWDYLGNHPRLSVIHLMRRNRLRQYLSLQQSLGTGNWWNKSASQRIPIHVEDCLSDLKTMAHFRKDRAFRLRRRPQLPVYYEDLVKHRDRELKKIEAFLNVPAYVPPDIEAQDESIPLPDLIENFEEVVAALTGTEWESDLELS